MNQPQVRPLALQAVDAGLAGVTGSVVDDPEDRARRCVGLGGHDLLDEPAEWLDPGLGFAAPVDAGVMDVPGSEIGQGPAAAVVKLIARRPARCGAKTVMAASE